MEQALKCPQCGLQVQHSLVRAVHVGRGVIVWLDRCDAANSGSDALNETLSFVKADSSSRKDGIKSLVTSGKVMTEDTSTQVTK